MTGDEVPSDRALDDGPTRGSAASNPEAMAAEIEKAVPGLATACARVDGALLDWFVVTNPAYGWDQAEQVPSSMAINDFADLLFDLRSGRGRPAARGCRSIFENLVTVLDVTGSAAEGERFLAHRPIIEQLASGITWELDRLEGRERKAEEHRIRTLQRDSKGPATDATLQYGLAFRRGWAKANLKDRANGHGLSADYAVYQLMSAVLHGSSGGALGTVRQRGVHGRVTHRMGPALALCPIAYLRGVTYFQMLVERLVAHSGRVDLAERARPLIDGLKALLDLWPAYRRAVLRLDEQMWATALPVPTQVTVLALDRAGSATWWLWDLVTKQVVQAREPAESKDAERAVRICRRQIENFRPIFWESRTHITIAVWDVLCTPATHRWVSSEHFVYGECPDAEYVSKEGFQFVRRDEWAPPPILTGLTPGGVHPMKWR